MIRLFANGLRKEIRNAKTGETYVLSGGPDLVLSAEDKARIVSICSQPYVYDILFRDRFNGRPYEAADADDFETFVREGWEKGTHFVFFVRRPDGEIVGAMDIKTSDLSEAEVGYWSDQEASGFTTNALIVLVDAARTEGYRKLYAGIRTYNEKSIGVVARAGFKKSRDFIQDGIPYVRYELLLTN